MTPILEVKGISKTYGKADVQVIALKQVDLTLHLGEFVALMGASGSGKSTFLHILGGLEAPDAGRLFIEGDEIRNFYLEPRATEYRRKYLGFVFQFFNLMSSLNAEENVELPLLLSGFPRKEIRKRTDRILKLVGLYERRHHRPNEMSGGQQQRVALARALVHNPPILLADEPTGNLDSQTTHEVLQLLVEMRDKLQQSILLVTHDPVVATYADRVLFFRDGQIVDVTENDHTQDRRTKSFQIMDRLRSIMEVQLP